ncbi:hypothetical protein GOODEAATRI_003585 [Goodea atripinnis]|uniref:Uncharacterized protein n=1 Tax=Goodea atripinnis TaxID=208336 RepID=A0ABV0P158_9TELE
MISRGSRGVPRTEPAFFISLLSFFKPLILVTDDGRRDHTLHNRLKEDIYTPPASPLFSAIVETVCPNQGAEGLFNCQEITRLSLHGEIYGVMSERMLQLMFEPLIQEEQCGVCLVEQQTADLYPESLV